MKIAIAMSGGIDSSVAAYLLKRAGFDVTGFTLVLTDKNDNQHIEDARVTADIIGIEHKVIDFKAEFQEQILSYFTEEYLKGRTPNPCIKCNRTIKFGMFLFDKLKGYGDKIATGHYAKITFNADEEKYYLMKGKDPKKDQSYFLSTLNQGQLSRIIFPISGYLKSEIIQMGKELKFPAVQTRESNELCFIEQGHYSDYIKSISNLELVPGVIEYIDGTKLGEHTGIINYTIGQRKGLGLTWKEPLYVIKILQDENKIIVGENEHLFSSDFIVKEFFWVDEEFKNKPKFSAEVKIRYLNPPTSAEIINNADGSVLIKFQKPVRAITPGQHAAVYFDDSVVGGGSIN